MCPRLDWMNMRSFFEAISVSCVIPAQSPVDDERTVFENLSFAVERGEIVDLVGPSGSGKSSLLTACARLNPHAHGAFALEGKGSGEFTPQQWRRDVAYLPQKPILTGKNVAEAIRLPWTLAIRGKGGKGEHLLPDERIRTTLDAMGCEDIDLERAQRAQKEALERLESLKREDRDFSIAEAKLKRALARIHAKE